jgi:nitric oxide reductase subunit B
MPGGVWDERWLGRSFWAMNVGLGLMVGLSLLPIGVMQAYASVEVGLWYARSAEFLQQPLLENLRWLRLVGDIVFLAGVAMFAWLMAGLWFGWSDGAEAAREPEHGALPAGSTALIT